MKKSYIFYIILAILLLGTVFAFYNFLSIKDKKVDRSKEKYIPIELEQDSVTKEIKVKNFKHDIPSITDTNKTKTYKEVFKEPKDIPLTEKLETKNKLSKLDQKSKQIIQKAEKLIKENNLELPQKELSEQEEEKLQKQSEDIKKLKKQLQELSNE